MKRAAKHRGRMIGRIFMLVAAAAVSGMLLTAPADAGRAHHRRHDPVKHSRRAHAARHVPAARHTVTVTVPHRGPLVFRAAGPAIVVPRRILRRELDLYRPYYRGTVFFALHGHEHRVYFFPVRTPSGLVLRPFHYCRGELLPATQLTVAGKGFALSVGF